MNHAASLACQPFDLYRVQKMVEDEPWRSSMRSSGIALNMSSSLFGSHSSSTKWIAHSKQQRKFLDIIEHRTNVL